MSTCPPTRRWLAGAVAGAALLAAMPSSLAGAASASSQDSSSATSPAKPTMRTAFGGVSYGSSGHFGSAFRSGRSAVVPLCTTVAGRTHKDQTQATSNPHVGSIGSVHTSVASKRSGGVLTSIGSARTSVSSLFDANISGDAFIATARAARSGSDYKLTGTTTLLNVHVFGQAAPKHPVPNQKMALPGVGSVVFNKQARSTSLGTHRIAVEAMEITLTRNNTLNLPAGSLVLSSARAALHEPVRHAAAGNAYGSTVLGGGPDNSDAHSGKTAPLSLPCGGTAGGTRSNETESTRATGLRTGVTRTHGRSTDNAGGTVATLTSAVHGVNLLDGVVKASTVVSRARAARDAGQLKRSSAGTSIEHFTINGQAQSANQPANTKHSIPGVGTLWVHRVVNTPNGLHVYALQLVLDHANDGLGKGSVITVAGTTARVKH